jgi:hypothetical protein
VWGRRDRPEALPGLTPLLYSNNIVDISHSDDNIFVLIINAQNILMAMIAATNSPLNVNNGDERTPLLQKESSEAVKYGKSVLYRALLCGFMVSLSFGVTQVP